MNMNSDLAKTARRMVAPGKGILAADESNATIGKRFSAVGVENSVENRRMWRQIMFEADGLENYISGVILFDETIRQSADSGKPFAQILADKGIVPGIKVDKSTAPLANSAGELITEGLDGLRARFQEYYEIGARFAKWRAVITIGDALPTDYCVDANSHALARYAALAQEAGLVPIVEPEVLMDGAHSIERCYEVTVNTLQSVFYELGKQRVDLAGIILKPSMTLSGKDNAARADADEVAERTMACLKATVPPAVSGVAFLSGGQADEEATVNLSAINRRAGEDAPWRLTFSYGRGLQASPLQVWRGDNAKIGATRADLLKRAKDLSLASAGRYN